MATGAKGTSENIPNAITEVTASENTEGEEEDGEENTISVKVQSAEQREEMLGRSDNSCIVFLFSPLSPSPLSLTLTPIFSLLPLSSPPSH